MMATTENASTALVPVSPNGSLVLLVMLPTHDDVMLVQTHAQCTVQELEALILQEYARVYSDRQPLGRTIRIQKCVASNFVVNRRKRANQQPHPSHSSQDGSHLFVELAKDVQVQNVFTNMEQVYVVRNERRSYTHHEGEAKKDKKPQQKPATGATNTTKKTASGSQNGKPAKAETKKPATGKRAAKAEAAKKDSAQKSPEAVEEEAMRPAKKKQRTEKVVAEAQEKETRKEDTPMLMEVDEAQPVEAPSAPLSQETEQASAPKDVEMTATAKPKKQAAKSVAPASTEAADAKPKRGRKPKQPAPAPAPAPAQPAVAEAVAEVEVEVAAPKRGRPKKAKAENPPQPEAGASDETGSVATPKRLVRRPKPSPKPEVATVTSTEQVQPPATKAKRSFQQILAETKERIALEKQKVQENGSSAAAAPARSEKKTKTKAPSAPVVSSPLDNVTSDDSDFEDRKPVVRAPPETTKTSPHAPAVPAMGDATTSTDSSDDEPLDYQQSLLSDLNDVEKETPKPKPKPKAKAQPKAKAAPQKNEPKSKSAKKTTTTAADAPVAGAEEPVQKRRGRPSKSKVVLPSPEIVGSSQETEIESSQDLLGDGLDSLSAKHRFSLDSMPVAKLKKSAKNPFADASTAAPKAAPRRGRKPKAVAAPSS